MQPEENKRKGDFLQHADSPEKIRKVTQTSSRFVNTLIGQWSKYTGMQISSTEDPISTSNKTEHVQSNEDLKIQILQKKLQEAEDSIVTLSSSLESELSVKDEISEKLSSTWESIDTITNYCNYMSESMKAFQEHINHLTTIYNKILETQKNKVVQQERQLCNMKAKDVEHQKYITQVEENLLIQEKKIQELISIKHELEQEAKGFEEKLSFEKNYLVSLHTEEKLKLIKEHEMTVIEKDQLQLSLKQMEEEKNKAADVINEKGMCITKLQEEMNSYMNQIATLSSQNTELINKIEKLEREKRKELQEKSQEVQQLSEILNKTKKKEDELTEDITKKTELCESLENNLLVTKNKLEKAENTIQLLQNNENTTIIKLHKAIETLEKEKTEMYTQYQTQIQHIKQSQKNLQEKQEIALKEEFITNTAEMKKTIKQLKYDITKLNEALTEAKAENNTLQDKIIDIKENNNKSQKSINYISVDKEKNQIESELKDKYVKHQKELALAEQRYRSVQVRLDKKMEIQEDTLKTLYYQSQSQDTNRLQNTKNDEGHANELQRMSSQRTPTQIFDIAGSQNQITETENPFGEKKFFKLRNTQIRRYGNRKNKIIRT
ncbi:hypothetical protein KPH14_011805 [Odynerus spinipes]|uniref:Uncharacterized protein n=1 Tax=Odynerus spinipes TaxID=1348599 RepID=A0AAD9RWJ9_9HYME|nr:hypothetical protein KPH14_011805 [Odynerus spinipes]